MGILHFISWSHWPSDSRTKLVLMIKMLRITVSFNILCCLSFFSGNVGEHEFIDVIAHNNSGVSERYIIDIDFRSHFQIARAVKPYNVVLSSVPAIYVGTMTKLKQLLRIMVEAVRYSLKQNSMPLPPWRSLPYLEAKWESPSQRIVTLHVGASSSSHQHCIGLLRRLKSFVRSDFKL